ncbi:DUF2267 domain-containing protein [Ornithinimicrobium flavum]|uniref:DUF2267 domain-containing protein n=1 Tax=Ornithinimicrobium flavum TaxID=1288636 RepID=UPI00106F50F3|nr:DUF2267 domain-containing protein [Ornithinimicrobium flavum]
MSEHDLVTAIQRRAGLRTTSESKRLLEGVLQALAYVLPAEHIDAVCACVPEDLVWCLRCGPGTPDPLIDSEVFLGWVMSSVETTGGSDQTLGGDDPLAATAGVEGQARVRAVLDELWQRVDARSQDAVAACLPSGVADHLSHAGGPERGGL